MTRCLPGLHAPEAVAEVEPRPGSYRAVLKCDVMDGIGRMPGEHGYEGPAHTCDLGPRHAEAVRRFVAERGGGPAPRKEPKP